jgi:hypothetical protein
MACLSFPKTPQGAFDEGWFEHLFHALVRVAYKSWILRTLPFPHYLPPYLIAKNLYRPSRCSVPAAAVLSSPKPDTKQVMSLLFDCLFLNLSHSETLKNLSYVLFFRLPADHVQNHGSPPGWRSWWERVV